MSEKSKVIIFDFDGVIVDSFKPLYEINRSAAEKIGKSLSEDAYSAFFSGNIHKKLKDFIGPDEEKNRLFTEHKYKIFSDIYNERTVKLFDFSAEMIRTLGDLAELTIVSSAPDVLIADVLKNAQLDGYFKNISGINKNGKRMVITERLDPKKDFYFVTDTAGDLSEVEGLELTSLGITWGFHDEKQLLEARPTYVVKDYKELMKLVAE
jgi:phosphoglycolate phosphatase-like HAD superfamily hydrolase